MSKFVGNLIPHTYFVTKGSGESDLELHAGSYHMALYDAGISDFNIMVYSSVIPATAHLVSMDEIDLPPFGSELNTIATIHFTNKSTYLLIKVSIFVHPCVHDTSRNELILLTMRNRHNSLEFTTKRR